MKEAVAAGVVAGAAAAEEAKQKKSLIGTMKRVAMQAAGNVALTSIVLILGFYFNSIHNGTQEAKDAADAATRLLNEERAANEAHRAQVQGQINAQVGLQLSTDAKTSVMLDRLAVLEARDKKVPKAQPIEDPDSSTESGIPSEAVMVEVTEDEAQDAREDLQQKVDKELYRQQQQRRLIPR